MSYLSRSWNQLLSTFTEIRVTSSVAGLFKLKIHRITRHTEQLFTAHMLKDAVST
jgi:hypothetical protein